MRGCTGQPQTKYYHSLTRCTAHALQLCLPTTISLSVLCRENSRIIVNTLHLSFFFVLRELQVLRHLRRIRLTSEIVVRVEEI